MRFERGTCWWSCWTYRALRSLAPRAAEKLKVLWVPSVLDLRASETAQHCRGSQETGWTWK